MKVREFFRAALVEALRDTWRAEGRAEQVAFTQAWLEEQRRAGRITFDDDLEVPMLGENGQRDD